MRAPYLRQRAFSASRAKLGGPEIRIADGGYQRLGTDRPRDHMRWCLVAGVHCECESAVPRRLGQGEKIPVRMRCNGEFPTAKKHRACANGIQSSLVVSGRTCEIFLAHPSVSANHPKPTEP
jgi:hypothetical protein